MSMLALYPGPFSCAMRALCAHYALIAHEKGPGYEAMNMHAQADWITKLVHILNCIKIDFTVSLIKQTVTVDHFVLPFCSSS